MESWKQRNHNHNHRPYGRYKANAPCRKHPKHRQSPGVCSICLNEKLSQLTNNTASSSRRKSANSPSSSSSSYLSSLSSSDASSYSSPVLNYMGSRARKSMRVFMNISGREVLKKSRSMAFFLHRRKEENENGKNIEIKRGFWSKLLRRRSKGLMHSRTMRERVVTAVQ